MGGLAKIWAKITFAIHKFFQNATCTVENLMKYFRAGLFTGSLGTG